MARSKSTSGGKTSTSANTSTSKDQTMTGASAGVPAVPKDVQKDLQKDVQAVAAQTAPVKTEVKVATEPRIATELRKKLEVVKTEPRRVVPINIEDEIRRRAYELYQQRGATPGSEREDWLAAEREVRQRYHQQSA